MAERFQLENRGSEIETQINEEQPSTNCVRKSNPAESIVPADESAQALAAPTSGSSPRRIAANRQNAKKSTGPKTFQGKTNSSWNSIRHGLLSTRLPSLGGQSKRKFTHFLSSLRQDLEPVGALEELLVEKIAQEYWRLAVAASHEARELSEDSVFKRTPIDRILRYQTTINRQFFQDINQLERLQRLRKGENVLAPLTLQVSHDTPTISDQENSEE